MSPELWAQPCAITTPTQVVDLRGRPDSTWTSLPVLREGLCCSAASPDKCIEFILYLDSLSSGIKLDIPTGAIPGGALFYQIGCGTSYPVGENVCLNGPGPHRITFCKPGGNINTYRIQAIPKAKLQGKLTINQACIGFLEASGLVQSTITWQSVPNDPFHNSFLSDTAGVDSVSVTPSGNFPEYVTYRVCGQIQGGCDVSIFCDTATIHFVTNIDVNILPEDPTICFGGTNATLTANPVGGLAPFSYHWSTGDTTQSISAGIGTYFVTMTDSMACTVVTDTVTVRAFTSPIDAMAGNDTTICDKQPFIVLNGAVQAASGGKWRGGLGTFSPSDTSLTGHYYPTPAEKAAGSVILKLITTGNGTCPPDSDFVRISFSPTPTPILTGPATVCAYKTTSYSTNPSAGNLYLWSVTGGTISGSNTDSVVKVIWGTGGAGTVTVKQTNSFSCDSSITLNILINPTPPTVVSGPSPVCAYKTTSYSTNTTVGNSYEWTVTGGTISGSNTDSVVKVIWGASGAGTVSVKQTNPFGCDSSVVVNILINPTPAPVVTGPLTVCAYKTTAYSTNTSAGNTYVWTVTGGTISGSNTDSVVKVIWGASGAGTVSVKQTNSFGCDSSITRNIFINTTPAPVVTGPLTVCAYKTTSYSTNTTVGNSYEWTVTGGIISGSSTDSVVKVIWGANGAGTVSVKQTNSFGCDSSITLNILINPTPAPVVSGPLTVCAYKTTAYSTNTTAGNTYVWTVTGGTLSGSSTDSVISVIWGASGAGTVSVKQTNSFGCDSSVVVNILINPTPAPVVSGPLTVCAYKTTAYSTNTSAGNTYVWTVAGGTISGSSTDSVVKVIWGASGAGAVTVKQTNSFGCDSSITRNILINTTPAPVVTGPLTVCAYKTTSYSTNTTVGNSYEWTVTGGIISGSNTDSVVKVIWGASGAGTVSVKQTNSFGCDSSITLNILINPTPAPVVSGPLTVCAYKTTAYSTNTAAGNTYVWTVAGGTISGSSTDSVVKVIWGASGTGTVSVKQTNSFGCDSSVVVNILINPTPTPVVTGPLTVCAYKTTAYSTNTTAGNTYVWTVTGGTLLGNSTDSVVKVIWGASGAGTVSVKQTNSFGCDSSITRNILINPTPAPVVSGPLAVCAYKTTAYSTNRTAGNTYVWTVTGGTISGTSTDSVVKVIWGASGAGTVTVKQTNALGCDSSIKILINIKPTPTAIITGPDTTCARKLYQYSALSDSILSYQWSITNGTIVSTNDNIVSVAWSNTGAGSLSLRIISASGCDTILYKNVWIKPTPSPNLQGTTVLCAYQKSKYTVRRSGNNQYSWQVIGGTIDQVIADTQAVIIWGASGIGQVLVRELNSVGCDSIDTLIVTLKDAPIPTITGPLAVCEHQTFLYTAAYSNNNTYQWSVSGGTFNKINDTTIQVTWGTRVLGSITLTQTNPTGCDSTISKPVLVNPKPVPVIGGPINICAHKNAQYTTTPSFGATYRWSIVGGTISGPSDQSTVSVIWTVVGKQKITLKQTNGVGCDSTVSIPVWVKPTPIPQISGDSIACRGTQMYTYQAPSSPHQFTWNVGIGGNLLSANGTPTVLVNWPEYGFNKVSLTLTDTIVSCDSTVEKIIFVDSVAVPVISPNKLTGCVPLSVSFNGLQTYAGYTYMWDFGNGSFSNKPHPSYVYSQAGTFETKITLTNQNGCKSSATVQIITSEIPKAKFEINHPNPKIYANEDTVEFINQSVGGNRYVWSSGSGQTDSTFNPKNVYTQPGEYTIELITIDTLTGCLDRTIKTLEVKLHEFLYVPNAFTPNGDGINDYFFVNMTNVVEFKITIFDRWGKILYVSHDLNFTWDGVYMGAPAQADVYGYLVEGIGFHGTYFEKKGTVTLLR